MPDEEKKKRDTHYLKEKQTGQFLQPRVTGPLDGRLPWVLEFRVVGSPSTILTQLRETMLLGRTDPDSGVFPEIDLNPFNGHARGVSRRHAALHATEGRITIRDLNSANGTRLNDYRLQPGGEYRLKHGDELTLGQLRLQVLFSVIPGRDSDALAGPSAPVVGRGRRVLVVAADANVSAEYQSALEQAGFQLTVTADIAAAMRETSARTPDVIVLDMVPPDNPGLDFLRYVRANKERSVPVLVTTSATGGFHGNKALEAGATAILPRPVSIEALVQAVGQATGVSD